MLFFTIPFYNKWLNRNILGGNISFISQFNHLDLEERKESRYQYNYVASKFLVSLLVKDHVSNAVILLPPVAYLKENDIKDIISIEPAVFYYYTGVPAVWASSPNAETANWTLTIMDNKLKFRRIENRDDLNKLLAMYKQYKPAL